MLELQIMDHNCDMIHKFEAVNKAFLFGSLQILGQLSAAVLYLEDAVETSRHLGN